MVRVSRALDISHLPLLALVPVVTRPVTDVERFSSALFARFEAVSDLERKGNDQRVAQREMLEQVQRWLELQHSGAEGA